MKRMKGLEPSTFCMASRRSSRLSYIRQRRPIIAGVSPGLPAAVGRRHPRLREHVARHSCVERRAVCPAP